MATSLPTLKHIERLSPLVTRILGDNPGKFSLQGTNTYLLGSGPSRILIDTGEGFPNWATWLHSLTSTSTPPITISTVLLTHWHHDHISGVPDLLRLFPSATIHKHTPSLHGDASTWRPITDGQVFSTEGATLTAVHCPGHTTDHVAFVLQEEGDAMFTGDNVLGHGTAVFEDMSAYMGSLERMRGRIGEGARAYPGHGEVIEEGKGRIGEYIAHRRQREEQVVEVLGKEGEGEGEGKGEGRGEMTAMEIVKVIYKDVPESLHVAAERGVVQILQKLVKDGKVEEAGVEERWRLRTASASL